MSGFGFRKEEFLKEIFLAHGGTGDGSSADAPLPLVDGDLCAIPAGLVIDGADFIIDEAITGTTVLEVGDDDDADGFITDQAANFATPGLYSQNAKVAGAYLRVQTAGATDAADIYVVPNKKYYSAAGKEVKLNVTTASTAGKARVVLHGYYLSK